MQLLALSRVYFTMVSKTLKTQRKKAARGKDYVPEAVKPERALPKPKKNMTQKKKWRVLGLAPTPGVYDSMCFVMLNAESDPGITMRSLASGLFSRRDWFATDPPMPDSKYHESREFAVFLGS